jgi:hypothetical protein
MLCPSFWWNHNADTGRHLEISSRPLCRASLSLHGCPTPLPCLQISSQILWCSINPSLRTLGSVCRSSDHSESYHASTRLLVAGQTCGALYTRLQGTFNIPIPSAPGRNAERVYSLDSKPRRFGPNSAASHSWI